MRVETHHGPLAELAFVRADTIDAALSTYGLATVADLDRVFRQVHRVLRTDRPFVFSLPHPAFVMLDPAGGEPVLRRPWWDTSPVTWSAAAGDEPDRPVTLGTLFSALGGPGSRSTPSSSRRPTGPAPARPGPTRCAGCPPASWCGRASSAPDPKEFPRSRVTIRTSRGPDR